MTERPFMAVTNYPGILFSGNQYKQAVQGRNISRKYGKCDRNNDERDTVEIKSPNNVCQ